MSDGSTMNALKLMTLDGVEAELPLEQLHDVKVDSIMGLGWASIDRVRRSIAKHFRQFLTSYSDVTRHCVTSVKVCCSLDMNEASFYTLSDNAESLEISCAHLANSIAVIAYFRVICPSGMLAIFERGCTFRRSHLISTPRTDSF